MVGYPSMVDTALRNIASAAASSLILAKVLDKICGVESAQRGWREKKPPTDTRTKMQCEVFLRQIGEHILVSKSVLLKQA